MIAPGSPVYYFGLRKSRIIIFTVILFVCTIISFTNGIIYLLITTNYYRKYDNEL